MKLTDEQRMVLTERGWCSPAWILDLVIESEQDAWVEVKRLKEENERLQQSHDDWKQHAYDMSHDIGKLEGKLQDALNTLKELRMRQLDAWASVQVKQAIERIQSQEGIQG